MHVHGLMSMLTFERVIDGWMDGWMDGSIMNPRFDLTMNICIIL